MLAYVYIACIGYINALIVQMMISSKVPCIVELEIPYFPVSVEVEAVYKLTLLFWS